MTTKELASQQSARQAWNEAFEEAEHIDHNQSIEPDELDRAVADHAERLERAEPCTDCDPRA
jgi:hypothetical protein